MAETKIFDHQSRAIQANSWDEYVKSFLEYDGNSVEFKSLTAMYGNSIPREVRIQNLKYDEFHLSCNMLRGHGLDEKKLAYLVR